MKAILLQVILIGLNAVFASAEIAVISMNDTKLERMARDGDARAKRLAALTAQPTKFLSTIQVAITLAGLLGSAFAAENFAGTLVQVIQKAGIDAPERILKSFSVFLITLVLAYFNLVFGELVPKRVAMKKAEGLALGMSGMLTGVSRLFAPLVALLTISTNGVLKLFGIDPTDEKEEVSEEEIYMMLEAGEEKGTIDAEETRWIRNVFAFDDISVEEICTHRVDMTVLGLEESDAEWQETILRSGYTYYPIYKENTDNIIGVLNTKVYFRLMEKNREAVMAQAVEKPYFVPEIMKADVLFRNMKQEIAREIQEMLEETPPELVGDIYTDEKEIEQLGIHTYRMKGSTSLDDVAETLGISLPVKEYDTLGGYIFGVLGHIPEDGTTFALETDGM